MAETKASIELVDPALRASTLRTDGQAQLPIRGPMRAVMKVALAVMPFGIADGVVTSSVRGAPRRIRHYRPQEQRTDAALVWIHGGGLVAGGPRQDDPTCSGTAADIGMQVFSLSYPLSPEARFPAAIEALLAQWDWLLAHAVELGINPRRVILGGESAGAGLASSLLHRLHDRGGVQPLGQWLFAPMLDDRTAADRALDEPAHWVWSNTANRVGWTSYLDTEPGGETAPEYAVPARRVDLSGLPPAFLAWGDIELFAAEDAAYAERLQDAGVPVTVDVVPGAPHGFENWARDTPPAQALLGRARDWLRSLIAA